MNLLKFIFIFLISINLFSRETEIITHGTYNGNTNKSSCSNLTSAILGSNNNRVIEMPSLCLHSPLKYDGISDTYPLKSTSTTISSVLDGDCYLDGTKYKQNYIQTKTTVCEWTPVPCETVPPPEGKNEFGSYNSPSECQAAISSFGGTNSQNGLSCWHDSCTTDIENADTILYGNPEWILPIDPEADDDDDGIKNKNDSDSDAYDPLDSDSDQDGDGIKNSLDDDDDGDGIPDSSDSDHPDYNGQTTGCTGASPNGAYYPLTPAFPLNEYSYDSRYQTIPTCMRAVDSNPNVISAYMKPDKNFSCERDYCYLKRNDCDISANDRRPTGFFYKSDIKTEDSCLALVDGTKYDKAIFDKPLLQCEGFCFVRPFDFDSTNPEDDNNSTDNEVDLNSTSEDNKAIVEGINKTNEHLKDLKDKTDDINNNLDKANESLLDISTSNKEMSKSLSEINKNLNLLNDKADLTNDSLSQINSNIQKSTEVIKGVLSAVKTTNSELSTLNAQTKENTKALNEGLFGDDPFADVDLTDDGSSTFGELGSQAEGALSITQESNIFGLTGLGTANIDTYSFNMLGENFVIFEPSMLNSLPIVEIRALFMFFFAIAGFITVFRTV